LRRHHLDDPMNTMRRKSLTLLALPVWLAELDSNYAALWNARMLRIQPVSGFQLARIWATNHKQSILNGLHCQPLH
jgi:hypothetical protein